jgi:hypothetical protein
MVVDELSRARRTRKAAAVAIRVVIVEVRWLEIY